MEHLTFSKHLEENEEYYRTLTKSWQVEDEQDNVILYNFHDGVDWKHHYAIAVNKEVKHILKGIDYHQAYNVFLGVVNCLK